MAKESGRGPNRGDAVARNATEKTLLAETDPIALLVGLRAARGRLPARPSAPTTQENHAVSKDAVVAEMARAKLQKAVR